MGTNLELKPDRGPARSRRIFAENVTPVIDAQTSDFGDVVRKLWRHKVALTLFALCGVSAALLISALETPMYRSVALVEVPGLNDNILNTRDVDPSASTLPVYVEPYVQTQAKILQSETVIGFVADRLKLVERPGLIPETPRTRIRRLLGLAPPAQKPDRDEVIHWMSEHLNAHIPGETQMVEVAFEAPDPQLAADVANAVVDGFVETRLQSRNASSARVSEWLTSQLAQLKAKVVKSETDMRNYARETGLLFVNEKDNLAEQRLQQLQESLTKAQEARVIQESKYALIDKTPADSLPEVLDDPQMREYSSRLTELKRQLAELQPVLAPGHYKVQQLQSQIKELGNAIERKRTDVLNRIRNEYTTATRQETSLTSAYKSQTQLVSDQAAKAVHYDVLKRELDTNRQIYEAMLQKLRGVSIASAMHASNVVVVDRAHPPRGPFRPSHFAYGIIGLGAGIFAGALFAVYPRRPRRRGEVHTEVARRLGIPELGLVPLVGPKDTSLIEPIWNTSAASNVSEAFRKIMVSILLDGPPYPQVVVVSSCGNGEGRTTVASHLAVALTRARRKVLLVDADVRKPQLGRIFGVENTYGLSNILAETCPCDSYTVEELGRVPDDVPGLRVMVSGTERESATTLLHSERMAALLTRMRDLFDVIVIDTPPILDFPDGRSLARLSDGVALVVRKGRVTSEQFLAALRRFADDGTPILGTIGVGGEHAGAHWERPSPSSRAVGRRSGSLASYGGLRSGYYGVVSDEYMNPKPGTDAADTAI